MFNIKTSEITGTNKLLKLVSCPGEISFSIYTQINDHAWRLISVSEHCSYGYKEDFKYNMIDPYDSGRILDLDIFHDFDENRIPHHTGFDSYMIYWTLEGKKVKDYAGWTERVSVVSDDNNFIIDFINKHKIEKKPYKYFKIDITINEISKERAFHKLKELYEGLISGEFITHNEHDCGKFSELPYIVCDTGEFEMQLTDEHIKWLESLKQ